MNNNFDLGFSYSKFFFLYRDQRVLEIGILFGKFVFFFNFPSHKAQRDPNTGKFLRLIRKARSQNFFQFREFETPLKCPDMALLKKSCPIFSDWTGQKKNFFP